MNVVQLLQDSEAVQPLLIMIEARTLAYCKRTKVELALMAADVRTKRANLVNFTDQQLAAIFRVSVPYIRAASKLTEEERSRIRRGWRPLIIPREPKVPATPRSPRERINEIVCEIGFDATLTLLAASESAAAA